MIEESYCLLIDNDEDDREIFGLALSEVPGAPRCVPVASGEAALRLFDQEPPLPAFIFIDMNMPGMDGRACLSALRARPQLAMVPIYMYSTAAAPRIVAELEGIAGYLEKPASFSELTRLLHSVIHPQQA